MIILKNATVLNFFPAEIVENATVVIDNDKIIDAGKIPEGKYKADKVIDLKGKYVSPGLVCSHNHFYSALARGIMAKVEPSSDFISVLKNLWWKLDRALDEETLYYSGLIGALEAIKCGTTSVVDHNASPSFIKGSLKVIADSFYKTGLRGIMAYEITDRNGKAGMEEGLQESVDYIEDVKCQREKDPDGYLVESAIGGHAPFTLSDATLTEISKALKGSGRGIHFHVAEDLYDSSYSHHYFGKDIMKRLEDFEIVNDKALLIHGVHLSDNDINIINEHDAFLVHNARSNMNNSVGYMNKLHKVKNGAIGTDGIGSNMVEELKFAFYKNFDGKGSLGFGDTFRMLHNGNEIIKRYFGGMFGKVEKGYKADLVVWDYDAPTPLVKENITGHIVFGFDSSNVDSVIVNGKLVYENRQFPFETAEIYSSARKAAVKLWNKMDTL